MKSNIHRTYGPFFFIELMARSRSFFSRSSSDFGFSSIGASVGVSIFTSPPGGFCITSFRLTSPSDSPSESSESSLTISTESDSSLSVLSFFTFFFFFIFFVFILRFRFCFSSSDDSDDESEDDD